MLQRLSPQDAATLRAAFDEAGYTEANIRTHLGTPELPSRERRNLPRLLDLTSAPTALNRLLRWFWLGISQTREDAAAVLPAEVLALLERSGLLAERDGSLAAPVLIVAVDG